MSKQNDAGCAKFGTYDHVQSNYDFAANCKSLVLSLHQHRRHDDALEFLRRFSVPHMHVLLQLVLLASAISLSFQQKCALKRPRDAQAALKPPANPGVDVDGANGTSISTPIPDPRLLPFNYANDKIRGVNL